MHLPILDPSSPREDFPAIETALTEPDGLLAVGGTYFLISGEFNIWTLLPASTLGFFATGVLNLNNMRDRDSDLKSGKNTLAVKLGPNLAKYYHYFLLSVSFLAAFLYTVIRFNSPWQFIFVLAYIPIGSHFYRVLKNRNSKLKYHQRISEKSSFFGFRKLSSKYFYGFK